MTFTSSGANTRYPRIACAALLLFTAFTVRPAVADLFTASTAYEAKDFDRAFKEFRALAELGQPLAQFNVAVMYSRGEGTRESELNAYAWAMVAADNGESRAKEFADKLRLQLAPGSEKLAEDIRTRYGRTALEAHLLPRIEDDPAMTKLRNKRCRPLSGFRPSYPPDAAQQRIQGNVYVEYTLMPDGHPRNTRITYATPAGVFDDNVRNAMLRVEFMPGEHGDPPLDCEIMFQFIMSDSPAGGTASSELVAYLNKTRKQAEGGDAQAQTLYGMMTQGLPQLHGTRSDALPWFLKAAQSGAPVAQFEVGYSLLKGLGCHCEEDKAMFWLGRAAAADESDAQVVLARALLSDRNVPDRYNRAAVWLERAAKLNDHDGTMYLSALLAASPEAALRDPKRSLQLLEKIFSHLGNNPSAHEIRAAAQANLGDFTAAVKSQSDAIKIAGKLHWDLTAQNTRLASYQSKQPWYGDLLEF